VGVWRRGSTATCG